MEVKYMGLIEAISGALVKAATTVVTAVTTAIAAPSIATVTTALVAVAATVGGVLLVKKGVEVISNKVFKNDSGLYIGGGSGSSKKSNSRYNLDSRTSDIFDDDNFNSDYDHDACENLIEKDGYEELCGSESDFGYYHEPTRNYRHKTSRFDNIEFDEDEFRKCRERRQTICSFDDDTSVYDTRASKKKRRKSKKMSRLKNMDIVEIPPGEFEGLDYPKRKYDLGSNGIGFRGIETFGR